jgi:hypothetical protein
MYKKTKQTINNLEGKPKSSETEENYFYFIDAALEYGKY